MGLAQQQRNLDNIVSQHPRISGGKKSKKEACAGSDLEVKNTSPMSEQDSGILDVEDEEEDEEPHRHRVKMAELESLETAAEHERILREIESTDTACIGPTLRSVYDGEEHGRFMEKLEARIRNHDREIEKMCNFHYQGFVDSITELLKVRGEAQKLKNQVTDTNRKLQSEGKELIIAMEELKQCRLQQRNISATVDKLTLCLPVLEMYSKLREQMKSKRHYPALKTLEHLEHTYLPQVSHYRFCKVMVDNIPKLREEIKEVSMSDLKDFLESIRKHSDKIGEMAMKQIALDQGCDPAPGEGKHQHRLRAELLERSSVEKNLRVLVDQQLTTG
ncbi:exocyst complex component 6B-like [Meleagris gallopavo]|uniref:exocyst complex component 6B-like n=1 Tax=Meleagris gallopavo TaxID=9103 RepID=UPI0012ABE576|nr:exocyst complex component 6B-like [Meleagris gallopavo]